MATFKVSDKLENHGIYLMGSKSSKLDRFYALYLLGSFNSKEF